jgi:phosphoesterase RecJ-like protein
MFEKVLELVRAYDKIIIHRHSNPDGDALGSQVGLKHIIKENFPEKTVLQVGDMTPRYAFIEDSVMDEVADEDYSDALSFVLDTSAPALISDQRYTLAKETVRIDHHLFIDTICSTEVVDTSYESCCGLITAFAYESGLRLNPTAAKALYTGMITDSGRFRYDSVSPQTFRMAAFLMEQKFDTADIYRNLYSDDFSHIRLRAQYVMKIQFTEQNVAYIYTPLDEAKGYEADSFTLSRGMVNVMGEIKGVDIWVNFTETESGVLCEIRSGLYNINPVAVKYGGGGHKKASGATLKDREEAMMLLADLNKIAEGSYEF